jgi:hypothetical protein
VRQALYPAALVPTSAVIGFGSAMYIGLPHIYPASSAEKNLCDFRLSSVENIDNFLLMGTPYPGIHESR